MKEKEGLMRLRRKKDEMKPEVVREEKETCKIKVVVVDNDGDYDEGNGNNDAGCDY